MLKVSLACALNKIKFKTSDECFCPLVNFAHTSIPQTLSNHSPQSPASRIIGGEIDGAVNNRLQRTESHCKHQHLPSNTTRDVTLDSVCWDATAAKAVGEMSRELSRELFS